MVHELLPVYNEKRCLFQNGNQLHHSIHYWFSWFFFIVQLYQWKKPYVDMHDGARSSSLHRPITKQFMEWYQFSHTITDNQTGNYKTYFAAHGDIKWQRQTQTETFWIQNGCPFHYKPGKSVWFPLRHLFLNAPKQNKRAIPWFSLWTIGTSLFKCSNGHWLWNLKSHDLECAGCLLGQQTLSQS